LKTKTKQSGKSIENNKQQQKKFGKTKSINFIKSTSAGAGLIKVRPKYYHRRVTKLLQSVTLKVALS
jgi:hypothetical protein